MSISCWLWQAVSGDRVAPVVIPVKKHADTARMQNSSVFFVVKKKKKALRHLNKMLQLMHGFSLSRSTCTFLGLRKP